MNICAKQIQKSKSKKDKSKKCRPTQVKSKKCTPRKCTPKKRKKTSVTKKCSIKQINYYKIIKPVRIIKPVKVVAKDLDIRNLNPTRDKVEIFGSNGQELLPIRTDSMGRLEVVYSGSANTVFNQQDYLNVDVSYDFTSLPEQDTRTISMISYAIANRGDEPVIVRLEISPNNIDYAKDMQDVVPPQSMRVFVPSRFLKWTRVSVATETSTSSTIIDCYCQYQTTDTILY